MNLFYRIAMFLTCFSPALVFAQSPATSNSSLIPVQVASLKLVGRGIENRKTHETLGFACVDNDCLKIRLVYFTSNAQVAYFIGATYDVQNELTPENQKQIEKVLKNFSKGFRKYRNEYNLTNRRGLMDLELLGFIGVGVGALFLIPMSATAGIITVFATYGTGGWLLLAPPSLGKYSPVIANFNERDGWNWASSPSKISSKRFDLMIDFIGAPDLHRN